jgi:hypothetical protein
LFLIFSGFLEEGERGESQEKGGREGVRQGLKPFLFCVLREGGKKTFSPLFFMSTHPTSLLPWAKMTAIAEKTCR